MTGTYVIEATGGSGGNGTHGTQSYPLPWTLGGLGAKIIGSFELSRGSQHENSSRTGGWYIYNLPR